MVKWTCKNCNHNNHREILVALNEGEEITVICRNCGKGYRYQIVIGIKIVKGK